MEPEERRLVYLLSFFLFLSFSVSRRMFPATRRNFLFPICSDPPSSSKLFLVFCPVSILNKLLYDSLRLDEATRRRNECVLRSLHNRTCSLARSTIRFDNRRIDVIGLSREFQIVYLTYLSLFRRYSLFRKCEKLDEIDLLVRINYSS